LRSGGTDVQVLIIVFRRFREIEFVDPEDTHSMELRIRKEGERVPYSGEFRNKDHHQSPTIDREHPNIIARIMRAQQKPDTSAPSDQEMADPLFRDIQDYWDESQVLLCRGVLISVVHLFPHIEVIICACVELEGNPLDPVEHEIT
jgi:hypothetical protein